MLFKYISTLWFIGYLPFAQGTFGALTAGIVMVIFRPSLSVHISLALVSIMIGVISSGHAEKYFKERDSRHIVIDEFAGYIVSLLFLPLNSGYVISAFVLFRFFDIIKPPPLKKIEDALKGGVGIVADDIGAGIYTNLILQVWKSLN